MEKLALECVDWRPLRRNTLAGFAAIRIHAMRLTILDIAIHTKGTSHWAALPSKPQVRDGMLVRGDAGKIQYTPLFEFDTAEVRAAFSRAAVAAVLELYPDALATEVAA
jgi:hypothetical protein